MSLIDTFLARVAAQPDAIAIVDARGVRVTYADLARASAARARAWAREGIGVGDVVLVARGVSVELYETLLAIFRLGAVAMFPEPAAGLKGLAVAIEAAQPKAMAVGWLGRALRLVNPALASLKLLSETGVEGRDDPVARHGGDAPALITFTSGSTGKPKGIVRSSDFLMLQHRLLEDLRKTSPDDVDLISLPVFILSNLAAGAVSVIPRGKLTKPARLRGATLRQQMVDARVTRVVAPPAVCSRLVEASAPMDQLTAVFTGGGPVFPNLMRSLLAFAPKAGVHAVYGSTEAEPIAHLSVSDMSEADWRGMAEGRGLLAGHPIREITVQLREHEVVVSGPHVNRGYLNPADDKSTKISDGDTVWHRTGDAARFDDAGRLWLLGRKDAAAGDLFPFAVETAALSWPGVRQAALLAGGDRPRLAIAGEGLDRVDVQRRANAIADLQVVLLPAIPLDSRHNSKTDYAALRKRLG